MPKPLPTSARRRRSPSKAEVAGSIVIAGGSLGGLRAAEHLRTAGWRGAIAIVEAP